MSGTIAGGRDAGVKAEGYTRGLRWVFRGIAPTGPPWAGQGAAARDAESWDKPARREPIALR